ncbi:MAG TPA: radical SAM protein, partial [Micromonosporaceae bacterium]
MLVNGVFDEARRLADAGTKVALFTGGWQMSRDLVERMSQLFFRISVSVDGATAEVHDRIRGRQGSYDRAMAALTLLDEAAGDTGAFEFGIDYVAVRSNLDQIEPMCTTVAPRFGRLNYLSFGAVVPEGLASREG